MTRDRRSLHSILRSTAVLFVLVGGLPTPAAHAATWWFGGTGTAAWDSTANWFSAAVSGTNPASVPNALTEDVIFNVTANNALKTYVYTDVGQSANSLTVDASGTTYFGRASTGASTLTVGSGGMTLGSTAGPVIFTGSSAPYAPITSSVMTVTAGADDAQRQFCWQDARRRQYQRFGHWAACGQCRHGQPRHDWRFRGSV